MEAAALFYSYFSSILQKVLFFQCVKAIKSQGNDIIRPLAQHVQLMLVPIFVLFTA